MAALWTLLSRPSSLQGSIIHVCVSRTSPLQPSSVKYLRRLMSSGRGALPAPSAELCMQESQMSLAGGTRLPRGSLTIRHRRDGSRKSAGVNVALHRRPCARRQARFMDPRMHVCVCVFSSVEPRQELPSPSFSQTALNFHKIKGCRLFFFSTIDPQKR